jgi:hypothetical protein
MRAVCFIRKFQLLLNCNNYENLNPKSRTSQTRKTLAASNPDDFNDIYFVVIFMQNYRIRTDNFVITLLPYFDKKTDLFA